MTGDTLLKSMFVTSYWETQQKAFFYQICYI